MHRVLVIEDDPDIAGLIEHELATAGYDVIVEHDGDGGLSAASVEQPSLIILDWMLPTRDGMEVCRALRRDPRTAGTPIVMLTALAQEPHVARAFAEGADDYVTKPFSPRALVARVQNLLSS